MWSGWGRRLGATTAALLLAPAAGCLRVGPRCEATTPSADVASRLVLEDLDRMIVASADIPMAIDACTTRWTSPGGVQVVTGIARSLRWLLQGELDRLLTGIGSERIPLRAALRAGRITCHQAFYSRVDGEFAGVAGLECRDALVLRILVDGRPLEQQVGLMDRGGRAAGMTREETQRGDPPERGSAADGPVRWGDVVPILEALLLVERDPAEPGGPVRLRICAGRNHLDRLAPHRRDPVLERASVRALIRLAREARGVPLIRQYLEDEDFPRRVFEDPEIRGRLAPLLEDELGRLGIESSLRSEVDSPGNP